MIKEDTTDQVRCVREIRNAQKTLDTRQRAVLRSLAARDRRVLIAVETLGMSYVDVARILKISPQRVHQIVSSTKPGAPQATNLRTSRAPRTSKLGTATNESTRQHSDQDQPDKDARAG